MWRLALTVVLAAALALAHPFLKRLDPALPAILAVVLAPLFGWLGAPLLMALAAWTIGLSKRSAYAAMQGRHYSFDEWRIRLFLVDEVAWIAETDLAGILGQAISERERRQLGSDIGRIPGKRLRGLTEDGLARLLAARLRERQATRRLARFSHWLQSEALPNLRRLPDSSAR